MAKDDKDIYPLLLEAVDEHIHPTMYPDLEKLRQLIQNLDTPTYRTMRSKLSRYFQNERARVKKLKEGIKSDMVSVASGASRGIW